MSIVRPKRAWSFNPVADTFTWSCNPAEPEQLSEAEEELNPVSISPPPSLLCSRFKTVTRIGVPLLLGQLLAGLIAVTAICSALLVQHEISLPLSQNLFHYCLLCLCYFFVLGVRSVWRLFHRSPTSVPTDSAQCDRPLLKRIGLYALAGLIDAHANWAFVAAYSLTSVTSVQLLDCLTIPTAMLLSILFLRHRFACTHYVAMVICLLGAGGMVAADVLANPSSHSGGSDTANGTGSNTTQPGTSSIILGDFLVILGAMAYAASNVLQQYLVMRYGIVNFLAYAGFSAAVPTAVYAAVFERKGLEYLFFSIPSLASAPVVYQCLVGYVAAMFLLYSLMPYVLAKTSAVLVNMSLLTADVYALLMGIFLFHNRFHILYILCFVVILFGVGLFSYRTPQIRNDSVHCLDRIRQRCCQTRLRETADPSVDRDLSDGREFPKLG